MIDGKTIRFEVRGDGDVSHLQHDLAPSLQAWFPEEKPRGELLLVVKELATNLVRHAGGGVLTVQALERDNHRGVQVQTLDWGPGVHNVEQALVDRYSTGGGLGLGLGTVHRLMDELSIELRAKTGKGTVVTCRKWVSTRKEPTEQSPLSIGVASRPHPHMKQNGDAFVVKSGKDFTLLSVIDGLGHGPHAHRASHKARLFVETHEDRPLTDLLRGVGHECRSTRGVVMTLARIDWNAGTLSLAGIGNVETRLFNTGPVSSFPVKRGILGQTAVNPVIHQFPWREDSLLVMFSDGIASHWREEESAKVLSLGAQNAAVHLLRTYAKPNDDATIVVAKMKSHDV